MKNRILLLVLLTSACALTAAGCGTNASGTVNATKSTVTVTERDGDLPETVLPDDVLPEEDGDGERPDENRPDREHGHCRKPKVILKRHGSAVGFYNGENGTFFFFAGDLADGGRFEIPLPDDGVRPPETPDVTDEEN